MSRPVLFLDFDDVICLNRTCGGYDAIDAIARIENEPGLPAETFESLWTELFDFNAKAYLQAIHDIWSPWFVLSSSWCRFVKKEPLTEILKHSGLGFVADNLHSNWTTPRRMHPDIRAGEIGSWHRANPGFENNWVILDDDVSGAGLSDWPIPAESAFIVLCCENVGLTDFEYQKLKSAFLLRAKSYLSRHQPR